MRIKIFSVTGAAWAVLGAGFIAIFFNTLCHIANIWFSARGSHGLIIAGISGYMIWIRRDALRQLQAEPGLFWGGLGTSVGCLLLVLGKLSYTLLIQYAAFLATVLGLVLLIGLTRNRR